MGKESMKLFMPIIASNLTTAVYVCQMMNPEMKANPEAAISDVILTWTRLGEVLTASEQKPLLLLQKVTEHLASEVLNIVKRESELKSLNPESLTPEQRLELQILPIKTQIWSEVATMLQRAAQ